MQLQYGNSNTPGGVGIYVFDNNSTWVTVSSRVNRNNAGFPVSTTDEIKVEGVLDGNGQDELNTKSLALYAALAQPYQDLVFLEDGSQQITAIRLFNAPSSSGVRITPPIFDGRDGAEFANYRRFKFSASAIYPHTNAGTSQAIAQPFGGAAGVSSGGVPPGKGWYQWPGARGPGGSSGTGGVVGGGDAGLALADLIGASQGGVQNLGQGHSLLGNGPLSSGNLTVMPGLDLGATTPIADVVNGGTPGLGGTGP
jgi:hypothetical protein